MFRLINPPQDSVVHLPHMPPTVTATPPNGQQSISTASHGTPSIGQNQESFLRRLGLSLLPKSLTTTSTHKGITNFCKNLVRAGIDPNRLQDLVFVLKGIKDELTPDQWGTFDNGQGETSARVSRLADELRKAYKANFPLSGKAEVRQIEEAFIHNLAKLTCGKDQMSAQWYDALDKELQFWVAAEATLAGAWASAGTQISREQVGSEREGFLRHMKGLESKLNDLSRMSEEELEAELEVGQFLAYQFAWGQLIHFPANVVDRLESRLGDGSLELVAMEPGSKTVLLGDFCSNENLRLAWPREQARLAANGNNPMGPLTPEDAKRLKGWMVSYLEKAIGRGSNGGI